MISRNELFTFAQELEGKQCWSIIAGKGTGSVVCLGFGDKIQREKPSKNSTLTDDERHFDPQFSLMIYCAWRIELLGDVLCNWRDPNDAGAKMLSGLAELRNKHLLSVEFYSPINDMALHFEGDLVLRVFCDQIDDEADDNYRFWTPNGRIDVDLNGTPSFETN